MPQQQPGVLHGAGELGQGRQGVQGPPGAQCLCSGLSRQRVDLVRLVWPCTSCSLLGAHDEGAEVSVKQLHPLDRLGPQVQIPLLEQEVLFVLVTCKIGEFIGWCGVFLLDHFVCVLFSAGQVVNGGFISQLGVGENSESEEKVNVRPTKAQKSSAHIIHHHSTYS